LAIVANPILPFRTSEIWEKQLNFNGNPSDNGIWSEASKVNISKTHTINAPAPLFARIDDELLERYKNEFSQLIDLKKMIQS
jgi:methionyl-tRNA synthetase